ncbi:uncharacterized protein THITE_2122099 [Thermothielavioides terrestris NRRL 8126]|uniref:PIG-P domain-containing protein n=1 Tax=Thermothielavioides terrestris (strain ATCC 38088 / NRRL 8126) TaxID=578455 RepID=G2RFN6_THETT|nr:uncharacterized protein THITE_2122099 [Thermothielavioides terrestris NRRL 8126]AEO70519.1 hypothetical protein THITE_2122099 [Thermothielavioides terrestris NRRL 8126]
MSATSEDDIDEDGTRFADGSRENRSHARSRRNASDLSQPVGTHDNTHDDHDDDEAYSSVSAPHSTESRDASEVEDEDDYDDNDNDDDNNDALPPPPPPSQHAFTPPFYGRPPTPLPPSPSLTSLLRPSRPTTPDASEDDGGGASSSHHPSDPHHHSHRHHHRHHPEDPLPRARPKVPTHEYYGFVLYLFSSLFFLLYLLWSYLPSPFLHALGIYYYPNRWWALAIPSWLVMLLVYIYVALAGYNLEILTLPLESVETIVDDAAQVAVVDENGKIIRPARGRRGTGPGAEGRKGRDAGAGVSSAGGREADGLRGGNCRARQLNWREVWNEGTDAVMDVPLAGVCEVLYGEGREWDSDLEDEAVMITEL